MSRSDFDNGVQKDLRESLEGGKNVVKLNPIGSPGQPQSLQMGVGSKPGYSPLLPQRPMFKVESLDKESVFTPAFKIR
jgi:hypothetical protein